MQKVKHIFRLACTDGSTVLVWGYNAADAKDSFEGVCGRRVAAVVLEQDGDAWYAEARAKGWLD